MTPIAAQNQVTKQNGIYDTPIGMSGKIDTKTGLLVKASQVGTQPYTVPTTPPPPIPITPTIAPPSGTTPGTDGSATIPPPTDTGAPTTDKTATQKILDTIGIDIATLGGKADATAKLQEEQQLAAKTLKATQSYNAYQAAQLAHAQTLEHMRTTNEGGTFGGAHEQNIAEYTARSNANLANLAVVAQADQGLMSAAQKTIDDKLNAQFQPVEDQIDRLTKFAQLNQNDLSDKEKIQLEAKIKEKSEDTRLMRSTIDTLHQNILDNGGNEAAFAALDTVTQDYVSGKLTTQQAIEAYYKVAGRYSDFTRTPDKKTTTGGAKTVFTPTQIHSGANKAGVTIDAFSGLSTDVQNYFVSTTPAKIAEIRSVIADNPPEDVLKMIDESDLSDPVKAYWKSKVVPALKTPYDNTALGIAQNTVTGIPKAAGSLLSTSWDQIKSLLK